jgi:hypothetical protein
LVLTVRSKGHQKPRRQRAHAYQKRFHHALRTGS